MALKRPKFGAEGAVLENFSDILENLNQGSLIVTLPKVASTNETVDKYKVTPAEVTGSWSVIDEWTKKVEDGGETSFYSFKKVYKSLSGANIKNSIESCAVEKLLESDNNKPVAFTS